MGRPTKEQAEQNQSRLRQCRIEAGYKTANDFVRAVQKVQGKEYGGGLNPVTYGRYETRSRELPERYAVLFGKFLDVRPEYLLYTSDIKTNDEWLADYYQGINAYHMMFTNIVKSCGYQFMGVMKKDTNKFVTEEGNDKAFVDSSWFTNEYLFLFLDSERKYHSIPGNIWANYHQLLYESAKQLFEFTIRNSRTS